MLPLLFSSHLPLAYFFDLSFCKAQFRRGRKGKTTSAEVGYLYSGKEGDSRPNDQAERRKGSGRPHTYREVCGSDKGNVNKVGYFQYSFVEMTLAVGQGVISLLGGWRGW